MTHLADKDSAKALRNAQTLTYFAISTFQRMFCLFYHFPDGCRNVSQRLGLVRWIRKGARRMLRKLGLFD